MRTITLNLYPFDELDTDGKKKALTTFRNLNTDFDWWNDEYDDFIRLCEYLGIAVIKESICFRGFYAQGDGSGFSAKVDIPKLNEAIAGQAWKEYAPLHDFPFMLPDVDRRVMALVANKLLPDEPQVICRSRQFGVVVDLGIYVIDENGKTHHNLFEELEKLQEWLRSVAEVLNKFLFSLLEQRYEYLLSDEAIGESLSANDYLFTADGRPADHLQKITEEEH
jgi:hypothetical protein